MKTKSHTTHVSEKKKGIVSELENLIKNKKTILIASIKGIPGGQFQEIVKKLRGMAIVKVPKKAMILRAMDGSKIEDVKKIKDQIKESTAILFSDEDPFDLAAELISKKSPARAKPGQEAPMDIEVPAGPTDLVPGPAISELGALGIQIQIEKGKITIKEPKIIAKEGEKISRSAAEMMTKLDIKPFSLGFMPLAAFDSKEGKIYVGIEIDKDKAIQDLKNAYSKSLAFAIEIGYVSKDTVSFLLQKAARQEMALENIVRKENEESKKEVEEEKPEETKENSEDNQLNETQEENK